ncbi:hypothetical protein KXV77_009812, partial [Aspergillus fumigatus]
MTKSPGSATLPSSEEFCRDSTTSGSRGAAGAVGESSLRSGSSKSTSLSCGEIGSFSVWTSIAGAFESDRGFELSSTSVKSTRVTRWPRSALRFSFVVAS